MKRTLVNLVLFISVVLFFGCSGTPAPVATNIVVSKWKLFYTSNRQGEVDPCGCSLNQLGGLARLDAYLAANRPAKEPTLFVDAGDTFFSALKLNPSRRETEEARARTVAKAYRLMKVNAFSPGEMDFAGGLDFLNELRTLSGTVFITSNLKMKATGRPLFEESHVFNVGGARVGVVGLASADAFRDVKDVEVLPPIDSLQRVVKSLRGEGVTSIVLLSHLGLTLDRELAQLGVVDVIVGSHSLDVLSKPEAFGTTVIVQPQNQGQQIGQLEMMKSAVLPSHQLVDLTKVWDGENEVATLMKGHKDQIREIALKGAPVSVPSTTERPFVAHPQHCRTCHQKQYDFWATTKHSSAYLVLFAKNEHFNPECIGCHSLGFQEPGGYESIARPIELTTPEKKGKLKEPFVESLMKKVFGKELAKGPLDSRLQPARHAKLHKNYAAEIAKLEEQGKISRLNIGVQCEHCHGNRNGHPDPAVNTVKKVQESSCRKCHTPPNANPFDPATFPKVACPLSRT